MEVFIDNNELYKVYKTGIGKYPVEVILAFYKKIQIIKNAKDERDLRNLKSNHFEKLKGYKNRYSIRLNDKYRLEFLIENENRIKIIIIKEISNHYS